MAAPKKFGMDRHRPPGKWVQACLLESVVGMKFRLAEAKAFAAAVEKAERKRMEYGVALAPQPDNPADRFAIAVIGQAMVKPMFGSPRMKEWHIGYVPKDMARELHDEFLSREIAIASEMYSIYRSGDYIDVKFFVLAPPGYSHGTRSRRSAETYK